MCKYRRAKTTQHKNHVGWGGGKGRSAKERVRVQVDNKGPNALQQKINMSCPTQNLSQCKAILNCPPGNSSSLFGEGSIT